MFTPQFPSHDLGDWWQAGADEYGTDWSVMAKMGELRSKHRWKYDLRFSANGEVDE